MPELHIQTHADVQEAQTDVGWMAQVLNECLPFTRYSTFKTSVKRKILTFFFFNRTSSSKESCVVRRPQFVHIFYKISNNRIISE